MYLDNFSEAAEFEPESFNGENENQNNENDEKEDPVIETIIAKRKRPKQKSHALHKQVKNYFLKNILIFFLIYPC